MVLSKSLLVDLSFVEALVGIVIAWILVALWQRFTENFFFGTMGLNPESSFQSFMVALIVTAIFLTFTYTINGIAQDIVVGNTSTMFGEFSQPGKILSPEKAEEDIEIANDQEQLLPISMSRVASIMEDIELGSVFV